MTMPDVTRLVTRSAAVCQANGMNRLDAYLLIAELASEAAIHVYQATGVNPVWLHCVVLRATELALQARPRLADQEQPQHYASEPNEPAL